MKQVISMLLYTALIAAFIAGVYFIAKYNTISSAKLISDDETSYTIAYGNGINDDNLEYHTYTK